MDLKNLNKPYIIAEIGCNHNGDIDLAKKMIDEAKKCGADAVKFQFFDEKLCTNKYLDELDAGIVKLENVEKWETKTLGLKSIREQIRAFANTKEEFQILRDYCRKVSIDFGCTAEDPHGVEVVASLQSDFLKIASNDFDNPRTIQAAINSGMPIIISAGMSSLAEIDETYNLFKKERYDNFAILHCVSIYPPRNEIVNLNFINTLQNIYRDCEIGYSDHTLGYAISLAAIAKGAKIIEKHFTLDKNMEGWDHKVSADPKDLEIICKEGQNIFECLGSYHKIVSQDELEKREKFRKSATTARDIRVGEVITEDDIVYRRPGTGITPAESKWLIGRKAKYDIAEDTTLIWDYFV